MALKTGISGLRGTVAAHEESLTATTVIQWVQAFMAQLHTQQAVARPFIVLGHDARRSSPALAALAKGALLMAGADVLDLGLTLTPTVQLTVRRDDRYHAGLMITASHNPIIWNGLKFLDHNGFFIPRTWWHGMRDTIARDVLPQVSLDHIGHAKAGGDAAWQAHLQTALDVVPIETIRQQRYRVALDACNGGAARWAELLEALGCEAILLHTEQHGFFAREAEPLPAHLGALQRLVRHTRCDLGLAADPDGDRLVLVNANGEAVSEEHTVVLVAMALARQPGDVVALNVVTTHAAEEALPTAKIVRTAVGEMNVVAATIAHDAVLGGEGSGGIIIPQINMARDGLAATSMILTLMAEENAPLHELVARIPKWEGVKTKLIASQGSPDGLRALFARWATSGPQAEFTAHTLTVSSSEGHLALTRQPDGTLDLTGILPDGSQIQAQGDGHACAHLFAALQEQRPHLTLDLTDGVKLLGDGVWISLRPSNTEPILRVMGEVRV